MRQSLFSWFVVRGSWLVVRDSWLVARKGYHTKVSTNMRDPILFNV
jgi:hypothetical protein